MNIQDSIITTSYPGFNYYHLISGFNYKPLLFNVHLKLFHIHGSHLWNRLNFINMVIIKLIGIFKSLQNLLLYGVLNITIICCFSLMQHDVTCMFLQDGAWCWLMLNDLAWFCMLHDMLVANEMETFLLWQPPMWSNRWLDISVHDFLYERCLFSSPG